MKFAGVFLICLSIASAQANELRVGGFVVAPFVMGVDPAPVGGALVEFIQKEVVPHAELHVKWMPPMSLERATASLRNGDLDLMLVAAGKNEDFPGIGLFDWPYLQVQPHLAVRPDSHLRSVNAWHQLDGMTLGWSGNNRSDIVAQIQGGGARWELIADRNWQQINLRKLAAGRIDGAFFLNQYSPLYAAQQAGIQIRLIALPLPLESFRMAYSLKTDKALLARFEKAAVAAFTGPQFKAFLQDYLKR